MFRATQPIAELSVLKIKLLDKRNKILLGVTLVFVLVTIVLLIAWKTGPFFYHFAEIRLVTIYSFLQLLATAYISFLTCKSLGSESSLRWRENPSVRPFLLSAIGFLYLGFDEILSLHENIDKLIHHILFLKETPWTDHLDDFILLAYGLVALYFIKDFIREFKRHLFMVHLIIGGFLLFFVMFCLDFVTNSIESFTQFFFTNISYADLSHKRDVFRMIEDSVKLLGEAFFLSAFVTAFVDIKMKEIAEKV